MSVRRHSNGFQRKLRFESLEKRQVLAASVVEMPAGVAPVDDTELTPADPGPIQSNLTIPEIQALTYNMFSLVPAEQIQHLTDAQIATIPTKAWLGMFNSAQFSALTTSQVRALRLDLVGLEMFYLRLGYTQTPDPVPEALPAALTQRLGWLTADQLQDLHHLEFKFLMVNQVPSLTPAQVGSIPAKGLFGAISQGRRDMLTEPQVQQLNIAEMDLDLLRDWQVAWLTQAQVQQIDVVDQYYRLAVAQIPWLSTAQIDAVIQPVTFRDTFTTAQRNALTQTQIQAVNVDLTLIHWMTVGQKGWLTPAQVGVVVLTEFDELPPSQMPFLTIAQIQAASVPNNFFNDTFFTDEQRAALTEPQIQAMNVFNALLYWMTPQQLAWLTPAQITQVRIEEIPFLADDQIPDLSLAQFANMGFGVLTGFSDEVKANLTRAQLMAMPPSLLSMYMEVEGPQFPPAVYHPAIHQFPLPGDPAGLPVPHDSTALDAFNLLNPTDPTRVEAINNGNWSSPSTWSTGAVPGQGAKVYIPQGRTVTFDRVMTEAVKIVRVDGTLTFRTDVNTTMRVDTIVVYTSGKLHIGTQTTPIAANVVAKISITGGAIDTTWDPHLVSRGLVSRGEVRMYGRSVKSYAALAVDPMMGTTTLTLAEAPTGWQPNDELVLTGTNYPIPGFQSERLQIESISGNQVTLKQPLAFNHDAPNGFNVHVANLNRNIQFIAEGDPTNLYLTDVEGLPPTHPNKALYRAKIQERPHIMFVDNPNVKVENVLVQGFGRTNKDVDINSPLVVGGQLVPGTGTNTRARYSIHFHHTGVNPENAPAVIRNNVVVGSPGWGYVNHQSNVVMEYNVATDVTGAGFSVEDGNEIGLMRANLSMNSRGSGDHDHILARRNNNDFGHGGHGFWFQGPGVVAEDNIVAGTRGAGFAFQTSSSQSMYDSVNLANPAIAEGLDAVPVGVAPLAGFRRNTAYAVDTGFEMWFHRTKLNESLSVVEDFKTWGAKQSGIQMFYSGGVTFKNAVLLGRIDVMDNIGVNNNRVTHDMVYENLRLEGFEDGLVVPPRRSTIIKGGVFNNVRNLLIGKGADTLRTLDVTEAITFLTPTPAQLAGRTPLDVSVTQQWVIPDNMGRKEESLFSADDLRIKLTNGTTLRLYYADQAASATPFSAVLPIEGFQSQWVGKTNQYLSDNFNGRWFNGGNVPAGAFTPSGFVGLAVIEASGSPADFDGNSSVDGRDFLAWQLGVGTPGGAAPAMGDANGDQRVDAADLDLWSEDFGTQTEPPPGAGAAVAPAGDDGTPPTAADLALAAMAYDHMHAETPRRHGRPPRRGGWRAL